MNTVKCDCGKITGGGCGWEGDRAETVLVEYMPKHLRASHTAAGNSGVYPHNGAIRVRVEESCAEEIVAAEEGWASVVDDPIAVRSRVAAGKDDDYDTGIVVEINGDTAIVAWDSGTQTPCPIADLVPTTERWSGGSRMDPGE